MARTPEQVEADEALTAGINRCAEAYQDDNTPWTLTEFMVVAAQHRWDDDGDARSAITLLYREDSVPLHRALGLAEYAATRLRATIAED